MLDERAKEILEMADMQMQEAVQFLEEDLKTYRLGKANPTIFNSVLVDYYGTRTPLPQMSSATWALVLSGLYCETGTWIGLSS